MAEGDAAAAALEGVELVVHLLLIGKGEGGIFKGGKEGRRKEGRGNKGKGGKNGIFRLMWFNRFSKRIRDFRLG